MAVVMARNADGEWVELGEPVEITMRLVRDDGTEVAPAGACPECARLPFRGHVAVCPHGVAVG